MQSLQDRKLNVNHRFGEFIYHNKPSIALAGPQNTYIPWHPLSRVSRHERTLLFPPQQRYPGPSCRSHRESHDRPRPVGVHQYIPFLRLTRVSVWHDRLLIQVCGRLAFTVRLGCRRQSSLNSWKLPVPLPVPNNGIANEGTVWRKHSVGRKEIIDRRLLAP